MRESSKISIRTKLWVGTPLATMFFCIFVAACGRTFDEGPGFEETEALNSLKAIYTAEIQYHSTYPAIGFACSLHDLGGDPEEGPPTPASAQLLQGDLPTGSGRGYLFRIANCAKARVRDKDVNTGYTITAMPKRTGHRGFCLDQSGEFKVDPSGGTNCTEFLK